MQQDRFGQTVTTDSAAAAAGYSDAVDALLALQSGSGPLIDAALEADPEFALAHGVKARSLYFEGQTDAAVQSARRCCELAANATRRERQHAQIVARVTESEMAGTLDLVVGHAREFPLDAMPLSFALGVYGLLGFGGYNDFHEQQRVLLEGIAPAWHEDWWFLSGLGWACVETGQFARGIEMLDRSLELKNDNALTAHARTHGFYETGAAEQGAAFIANWLPGYAQEGPLHGHLAWHLALFQLQRGEVEQALRTYHEYVSPSSSLALPLFTVVDSAAFLWRCRLAGRPQAPAQEELVNFARDHFPKAGLPFVNLHNALAYAGSGDDAALTGLESGVAALLAADRQICGVVIAQLCSAVSAYSRGEFTAASGILRETLPELERIGGSHAQRDVVIDTLVSALLRSGDTAAAREVMRSRSEVRAGHLDETWFDRLDAG